MIEVDACKIKNFTGNVINLGNNIPSEEFLRMMNPNPANVHKFEYGDGLLRLNGETIPSEEIRHPTTLDEDNIPSIMVIKCGVATGVTVGRANNILSWTRHYHRDKPGKKSKEWIIFPSDSSGVSGPFADHGDSGAVVVDGRGRIGGLLTGGAHGTNTFPDYACVTPIDFILGSMKDNGILNPTIIPGQIPSFTP